MVLVTVFGIPFVIAGYVSGLIIKRFVSQKFVGILLCLVPLYIGISFVIISFEQLLFYFLFPHTDDSWQGLAGFGISIAACLFASPIAILTGTYVILRKQRQDNLA